MIKTGIFSPPWAICLEQMVKIGKLLLTSQEPTMIRTPKAPVMWCSVITSVLRKLRHDYCSPEGESLQMVHGSSLREYIYQPEHLSFSIYHELGVASQRSGTHFRAPTCHILQQLPVASQSHRSWRFSMLFFVLSNLPTMIKKSTPISQQNWISLLHAMIWNDFKYGVLQNHPQIVLINYFQFLHQPWAEDSPTNPPSLHVFCPLFGHSKWPRLVFQCLQPPRFSRQISASSCMHDVISQTADKWPFYMVFRRSPTPECP